MEKLFEEQNNLAKELITTASSSSYIQVINPTTGKVQNLKISDLASVVAALIGNPLSVFDYYIGNINAGENLKSISTPGIYTNVHGNGIGIRDDGTLIVIKCFGGFVRIFLGSTDKNIFYNTERMGTWHCISTAE